MKVSRLIELLQTMPPEAEVFHLWDGELRTAINHVWLTRGGDVATADNDEVCYTTESRPVDAPTSEQDPYWHSPKKSRGQ